jgi:hypothetical protein
MEPLPLVVVVGIVLLFLGYGYRGTGPALKSLLGGTLEVALTIPLTLLGMFLFLGALWFTIAPFCGWSSVKPLSSHHILGALLDWSLCFLIDALLFNVHYITYAIRALFSKTDKDLRKLRRPRNVPNADDERFNRQRESDDEAMEAVTPEVTTQRVVPNPSSSTASTRALPPPVITIEL